MRVSLVIDELLDDEGAEQVLISLNFLQSAVPPIRSHSQNLGTLLVNPEQVVFPVPQQRNCVNRIFTFQTWYYAASSLPLGSRHHDSKAGKVSVYFVRDNLKLIVIQASIAVFSVQANMFPTLWSSLFRKIHSLSDKLFRTTRSSVLSS